MENEAHKKKPLLVVIAGPTAVGKTNAAIKIAQFYKTEILSADSRQCYKELNIGVARPSKAELAAVPHYFIQSHSIFDKVDAALFESFGNEVLINLFSKSDVAIMVGGTGLYIKAVCEGVDPMPAIPENIRTYVRGLFEKEGLVSLLENLREHDPVFFEQGEIKNPHRVMRALEISLSTGQSILHYRQKKPKNRSFNVLYLGMLMPKQLLNERINTRVDDMIKNGLVKEATGLLPFKHLNAMQTVGYSELFDYLEGKTSLNEAIELIKIHTRQYAKRQMTWFNKTGEMNWVFPDDIELIKQLIEQHR